VPRRPKSTPERAARVFSPPADLLLTEEDLREWRAAIAPALEEAGCELGAEVVCEVRPADWTVSTFEEGPDGGRLAPAWTVARLLQVELRLSGDGGCAIEQARPGYKSARDVGAELDRRAPRWRVPPRGRLPFAVGLRERNGWEGEAWSYWLPIAVEADVLALAAGAPVALGRDLRATPFDPPSLAAFGAWRLELRYLPEWRARYLCETSRVGYMPYYNWAGESAPEIAALVAEARARGILRWRPGTGAGLHMWKGTIELYDEDTSVLGCVDLA